jgi:hypothetical protein
VIKLRHGVADLVLRAEARHALGQPLALAAQLQRRGQELVGRHTLLVQLVPQPGQAVVRLAPVRQRLARARQIVEGAPFLCLLDLLVDPRREAHSRRLAFRHAAIFSAPLFSRPGGRRLAV